MPILFLLLMAPSFGFINIEQIRRESGKGFIGKSSAKFSGQRGNTNKLANNITTLNIYRYPEDEILFLADYVYSLTQNVKDTNNGRIHIRYTFKADKPTTVELFTQSEFDEFRDLKWRNIFGSNLRYRLLNQGTNTLYLGTGLFYELATFNMEASRSGFRGNLYLSYVVGFNDRASAYASTYLQPSLQFLNDVRFLLSCGLLFSLTERLSAEMQFNLNYDSVPPMDIVGTDITYFTGFSLKY